MCDAFPRERVLHFMWSLFLWIKACRLCDCSPAQGHKLTFTSVVHLRDSTPPRQIFKNDWLRQRLPWKLELVFNEQQYHPVIKTWALVQHYLVRTLCLYTAKALWASYFTSPHLSSLIYEMGRGWLHGTKIAEGLGSAWLYKAQSLITVIITTTCLDICVKTNGVQMLLA